MNKGRLMIVSGFSGVGKGTVIRELMEQYPGEYAFSVSATTRAPREGETDGVEYYFVSRDTFLRMIDEGAFLEYARYTDNYYGTPAAPVLERLSRGENIILDIEVQGAMNVKRSFPEAVSVFLLPPSGAVLYSRLAGRGTETEAQILGRLIRSCEETKQATDYDYYITNVSIQDTVAVLRALSTGQAADTETAGPERLMETRAQLEEIIREKNNKKEI